MQSPGGPEEDRSGGLKIFPVVLGKGKRLFGEGTIPAGLKLVESKASTTGVIVANYVRAGRVKTGSFALETPTVAETQLAAK
jgi:hypothetical protein